MEKNPHNRNKHIKSNKVIADTLTEVKELDFYPASLYFIRRKALRIEAVKMQMQLGKLSNAEGWAKIGKIELDE